VCREKNIYWTVLWLFPQANAIDEEMKENKTLAVLHHSVSESDLLEDSFRKFLVTRWKDALLRQKLAEYYGRVGIDAKFETFAEVKAEEEKINHQILNENFVFLLRKTDSPACRPEYYVAKDSTKLVDFLAWISLVEFPEVMVDFKDNLSNYAVVEKTIGESRNDRSSTSEERHDRDEPEPQEEEEEEGAYVEPTMDEDQFELHVHADPEIFEQVGEEEEGAQDIIMEDELPVETNQELTMDDEVVIENSADSSSEGHVADSICLQTAEDDVEEGEIVE
jgi:hypothetical protein